MKILIVEDNEDSRILLESALTLNGYEVESAKNGREALDAVARNIPDLIISDILMPEIDGFALCKALKADISLSAIPFIFYTATYTDPKDEKLGMELGAAKFLLKPMEIDLLLEEIQSILDDRNTIKNENGIMQEINMEEIEKKYSQALSRKLDDKVKQLELEKKKLEKSEKKYRRLVEVLRDNYFFFIRDTEGAMLYVSPSILNVLGYDPDEYKVNFADIMTGNDINEKAKLYIAQGNQGVKQPSYEVEVYHKNGNAHHLIITEEPVANDDNHALVIEGIAHDISSRMSIERQLIKAKERLVQAQKMEAIGTLAGGIAHDFNNILSVILGFTEIAKSKLPADSDIVNDLGEVLVASGRAKDLINQILSFSRQSKEEKKPVLMQSLVKETLKMIRSSIPVTIEIRESIENNCGAIFANSSQMHQILMNLCTNAYYAMREQGGILAVSLSEITFSLETIIGGGNLTPGKYIRLEISDTGAGIEKSRLSMIFDPYYTTKPKDEGTGLGLAVVHGIVSAHDGQIMVYSEVGKGSTFQIFFPVITADTFGADEAVPFVFKRGTEKILIIDDDVKICQLEKRHLENLGYSVDVASDCNEALKIFRNAPEQIDLVITDMTMPEMTGADLSKQLLQIRPDLPIIMITGYSELIDREQAEKLGIKKYLMKPVSSLQLASVVYDTLQKSG